jgi:SNF2 domain-containing protein/helicase-like protein
MIALSFTGTEYIAACDFSEKDTVKAAGFRWRPETKQWWTNDEARAAKLAKFAHGEVGAKLAKVDAVRQDTLTESRATDASINIPVPEGLAYLPYQRAGIAFCLKRPRVLLADDMGLGKTVQAIGVINGDPSIQRTLVICPASLRLNWYKEARKWLVRPLQIAIASTDRSFPSGFHIVIMNYDILRKFEYSIRRENWDLLICDEAHAMKNPGALRSKMVLGYTPSKKDKDATPVDPIESRRTLFLTGTPITNRPKEIFPLIHYLDPGTWSNFFSFTRRYCAGEKGRFGYDASGSSNLGELQDKLRSTCFPYETLVETTSGPAPIGEIVENGLTPEVFSYDFVSSSIQRRRVVAHIKPAAPGSLIRVQYVGGEFSCTADHKIWTQAGWVRAENLVPGLLLSVLPDQEDGKGSRGELQREVLLGELCGQAQGKAGNIATKSEYGKACEKTSAAGCKNVQDVRDGHASADHWQGLRLNVGRDPILWEAMRQFMEPSSRNTSHDGSYRKDGGGSTENITRGQDRGRGQAVNQASREKVERRDALSLFCGTISEMGKGEGYGSSSAVLENLESATSPTCRTGLPQGLARAGHSNKADRWAFPEGGAVHAYGGYDSPALNDGYRGRREDSRNSSPDSKGPLEGGQVNISRVVSVEVVERGGRPGLEGCGGFGEFVYDIEVEGNHNYFANGCLVSNCMVRRLKGDVLKELPPKRRQVIEMPANGAGQAVAAEMSAWRSHEDRIAELRLSVELAKASDDIMVYRAAVAKLQEGIRASFTEMAKLRHDTAVAKVPYVVEHIKDCLDSGEKLLVFAHHLDVIDAIVKEFPGKVVKLDGRDSMEARNASVERFQKDPTIKLFVGGIMAAGVGLTLTAASHAVFAELDWVPANITQGEDRLHRIGQRNSVLIQHLVLEGSLDARMVRILVEKQEVIDRALDKQEAEADAQMELVPIDGGSHSTREAIHRDAESITPVQITAIHGALRLLAGMCDGARQTDGAGLNKLDSRIGKSLAEGATLTPRQAALGRKIARKYKRQLGDGAVDLMFGKESA